MDSKDADHPNQTRASRSPCGEGLGVGVEGIIINVKDESVWAQVITTEDSKKSNNQDPHP